MKLNEFRAWLEGFSESFKDNAPSVEQFEKIMTKLGEVEEIVVPTQRIFPDFDRWKWPYIRQQWEHDRIVPKLGTTNRYQFPCVDALSAIWDTPEEDAAWAHLQDM